MGGHYLLLHRELLAMNWHPFIPPNEGFGQYGISGVLRAAGIIFFAYIGFDGVSAAAQEVRDPARDMPIGILGSLVCCTVLCIMVPGVLRGWVKCWMLIV